MINSYTLPKTPVTIDGKVYIYKKQTRHKKGDCFITVYIQGDKKQDPVFYTNEQQLEILSRLDEEDILYFMMKKKKNFLIVDFPMYIKLFRTDMYNKYRLLFE